METADPAGAQPPVELASTVLIWLGLMLLFVFAARSLAAGTLGGEDTRAATAVVREAGWACVKNGGFLKWCPRATAERGQGRHYVRIAYRDEKGQDFITLLPTDRIGLTPETAKKGVSVEIAYDPGHPGQIVRPQQAESGFTPLVGFLGLGSLAAGVWLRFGRRSAALAFVDADDLDDPLSEPRAAALEAETPTPRTAPPSTAPRPQAVVFGRRKLTGP